MEKPILFNLERPNITCGVCQHRCHIAPGKTGACRLRKNENGTLRLLEEDSLTAAAIDPIEKKPLYHFYPGSRVFSMGGVGCNFHCRHCQNWQISQTQAPQHERLSPKEAVEIALRENCQGIAWTYNEPTMWFEYTLEMAKLAKAAGLYTVYVTNGYLTPEALDLLGPVLDAFRVDIKGFSDRVYRELARIPHWRGILEVTERAQKQWGMHVEVVTNVIPTMNDSEEELKELAGWIKGQLGPKTPWHVTRFFPCYELTSLPPTPVATIEKAVQIGKEAGLEFVYGGNLGVQQDTLCPTCNRRLIQRQGYETANLGVTSEGTCPDDQTTLNIRGLERNSHA